MLLSDKKYNRSTENAEVLFLRVVKSITASLTNLTRSFEVAFAVAYTVCRAKSFQLLVLMAYISEINTRGGVLEDVLGLKDVFEHTF